MKTTIYTGSGSADHTLRSFVGSVPGASMWMRITNILRNPNETLICLATSEEDFYITADNNYYIVKE